MSRSPREDWKHAAAARPGRPGVAQKPRRRSRLILAVIPLLAAIGIAAGLFFFWRPEPKPLFLSLCVAEYDAWPVNAWAQQDGEALKQHFPDGKVAFQSQEGDGLIRELEPLAERAQKERHKGTIIHVCALAVADAGSVSILPAKAAPGSPEKWLPLSRVLEAVGKISGNRFLILDLRPVADPRLGQDGTELAKALHDQLSAANRDGRLPFIVFAQCAPPEYPFVSPELRRGIMAEFLDRGLSGHADAWNDAKTKDNQVSAQELMSYTRGRMALWLQKHQAPALLPVAYGTKEDFILVTVPLNVPSNERELEPPLPSAKVNANWARLDDWRKDGAQRKTPRTFRQLEVTTARADRLVGGGGPVEVVEADLDNRVSRSDVQRKELELQPYPVASVGRARRTPIPKENEVATSLQSLLDELRRPGAKQEELKGKLDPFWKMPPEASPFDATVSVVLNAIISGDDLTAEQLKGYQEALRGLKAGHLEISILAFFSDPGVEFRKLWPGGAPRAALRAAIDGERAAAVDGRALKRIEGELADADAAFRGALLTFLKPNQAAWGDAVKTLVGLSEAYEKVRRLGEAYEKALYEWEETVVLLVTVDDFAPPSGLARQALDDAWTDLVSKARRLREGIDGTGGADVLGRLADDVSSQRQKVVGLLKEVPDNASPVDLRARLRLMVWNAIERQQLTIRANMAAIDLARQALSEGDTPTAIDVRSRPAGDPLAADAAARRVKRATDLVALAGEPLPGANEWRLALADRLIAHYRKDPSPAARERFAWLIHPDDLPATPETPGGPRNEPATDVRRNAEQAMARWLADKRWRPLADELNAQSAKAAKALAADLYEVVRRLNTWRP